MEIGFIGLGKMGLNLTLNMTRNDMTVIAYDIDLAQRKKAQCQGVKVTDSLEKLVSNLKKPRIVWVMVPCGLPTSSTLDQLKNVLEVGDIIIEGGNSHYKDSVAHYALMREKDIHFFDCGTSGGMEGALNGGNFMIGGDKEVFPIIEPIFQAIADKGEYLFTGDPGSGHYLKMVHNGIEYGMMQAIGEGFDVLEHSQYHYDNGKVAELWNNGSVIRSWLMALLAESFKEDPDLIQIKGVMESSGEGKWTVEEALKNQVAIPVIATSLMMRYRSLEEDTFTGKVVATLRKSFGGHSTHLDKN